VVIVDPPRVWAAGLFDGADDAGALRSFRCFAGAGVWYEREAEKALRRATRRFTSGDFGDHDRILLFHWDDELLAVCVFSRESAKSAHLSFVGLKYSVHGARIDASDGPRLSDAVLESCLEEARLLGFERMTAQVARDHAISRAMLDRAGFAPLSRVDQDYDLWAIALR
jgi:RimJ/RimL family protein N-acetyltransferase